MSADREWPSVSRMSAYLRLIDGDDLVVAVAYGGGRGDAPTTIRLSLGDDAVREFADLAAVVREVLEIDGAPTVADFRRAVGTVRVSGGLVSVHARELQFGGPVFVAADLFIHNDYAGNYSVCFRPAQWAEIETVIADAARRRRTAEEEIHG